MGLRTEGVHSKTKAAFLQQSKVLFSLMICLGTLLREKMSALFLESNLPHLQVVPAAYFPA